MSRAAILPETNKLSTTTTTTNDCRYDAKLLQLESLSLRYYVYDDPNIVRHDINRQVPKGQKGNRYRKRRYREDDVLLIMKALLHHPLRTMDAWNADLFIVPTIMAVHLIWASKPLHPRRSFGKTHSESSFPAFSWSPSHHCFPISASIRLRQCSQRSVRRTNA